MEVVEEAPLDSVLDQIRKSAEKNTGGAIRKPPQTTEKKKGGRKKQIKKRIKEVVEKPSSKAAAGKKRSVRRKRIKNKIKKIQEKGSEEVVEKSSLQANRSVRRKRVKNKIKEVHEKVTEETSSGLPSNQIEELAEKDTAVAAGKKSDGDSKRLLYSSAFFMALIFISMVLFLLAGHAFPATNEDIEKNRLFWIINNGNFDRDLFTQFYIAFIFTMCVFLLGFYVSSTFVRYGIKNWAIFRIGIYLLFLYGLGKIGKLTFNSALFSEFEGLILPVALAIMAYALYKISREFEVERLNV
ncbi:MAG TPA: hypothetical protein VIO11_09695 [Candidatus Methanoperedens sp.]